MGTQNTGDSHFCSILNFLKWITSRILTSFLIPCGHKSRGGERWFWGSTLCACVGQVRGWRGRGHPEAGPAPPSPPSAGQVTGLG
jgi:hypothetical protein